MALENLLGDLALDETSQSILTELGKKADVTETQPVNVQNQINISSLATSDRQLPDNHQVTVSNPATGFSTSANQTNGNQKTRIVDSTGAEIVLSEGSVPTILQDQHSDPVDYYFVKAVTTTTLLANTIVDQQYVETTSTTGATNGLALTIIGSNGRVLQATIISVSGNKVYINVPVDKVYPAGSYVSFGNWNLNVDGSITKQIYRIKTPLNTRWDIDRVIFSIIDDTAMDDGKFGGITYLTNGIVLRKNNGVKKNIMVVSSNGGFAERCFDVRYADKAPSGSYGFTAKKDFKLDSGYGVVIRLDGDTNDELEIIVQDNLTGLQKFAVVAQGHITQEF